MKFFRVVLKSRATGKTLDPLGGYPLYNRTQALRACRALNGLTHPIKRMRKTVAVMVPASEGVIADSSRPGVR